MPDLIEEITNPLPPGPVEACKDKNAVIRCVDHFFTDQVPSNFGLSDKIVHFALTDFKSELDKVAIFDLDVIHRCLYDFVLSLFRAYPQGEKSENFKRALSEQFCRAFGLDERKLINLDDSLVRAISPKPINGIAQECRRKVFLIIVQFLPVSLHSPCTSSPTGAAPAHSKQKTICVPLVTHVDPFSFFRTGEELYAAIISDPDRTTFRKIGLRYPYNKVTIILSTEETITANIPASRFVPLQSDKSQVPSTNLIKQLFDFFRKLFKKGDQE